MDYIETNKSNTHIYLLQLKILVYMMSSEILILVDREKMDLYKGALEGLKSSYIKWGFKIDKTFIPMVFRGDLDLLGEFKEFHMEHFDENQIFGREFLFIIRDSVDDTLKKRFNNFPIFNYGYWQIYDIPATLLLFHKNSQGFDPDIILNHQGTKKIFDSSYFLSKGVLESSLEKFLQGHFTIFKCYPIGGSFSIDTWKGIVYKIF